MSKYEQAYKKIIDAYNEAMDIDADCDDDDPFVFKFLALRRRMGNLFEELNGDQIAIRWCFEDIISRAEEMVECGRNETIPTEDEARDILKAMEHNHDCNYGITWDTIDYHLDELDASHSDED